MISHLNLYRMNSACCKRKCGGRWSVHKYALGINFTNARLSPWNKALTSTEKWG